MPTERKELNSGSIAAAPTAIVRLTAADEAVLAARPAVASNDAEPDEVTPLGQWGLESAPGGMVSRTPWRRTRAHHEAGAEVTAAIMIDGVVSGAARLAPDGDGAREYGVWCGRSARGRGVHQDVLGLATELAAQLGATGLTVRTSRCWPPVGVRRRGPLGAALIEHLAGETSVFVDDVLVVDSTRWSASLPRETVKRSVLAGPQPAGTTTTPISQSYDH